MLDAKVANDTAFGMEGVAAFAQQTLEGGRTVACKTGTAGIEATAANSDAWMAGFTTQVAVASWVGSNTLAPIYNDSGSAMYGRNNAGTAWRLFMDSYLAGKPNSGMPTKQEITKGTNASSSASATSSPTTSADADHERVDDDGAADDADDADDGDHDDGAPDDGDHDDGAPDHPDDGDHNGAAHVSNRDVRSPNHPLTHRFPESGADRFRG